MQLYGSRSLVLLAALGLVLLASGALAWGLLGKDVPSIGVDEILAAAREGERLQLVDVRSEAEIAISVIPGAITRREYEQDPTAYADVRIVPYCTVGVRSASYTRKLRERGVNALNFQGSILGWVEAGQPLITPQGESTHRVHTYSKRFTVPKPYVQVVE